MAKINKGLMSSNTYEWGTPQELFDTLNKEFHFTLDPCATKDNAKCEIYYTKQENGLSKSWNNEIVFMNPPYGTEISKWVEKGSKIINGTCVCLLPARTDTKWFHNFIYNKAEIRFIKGRLKFTGDNKNNKPCKYFNNAAPFPSMIVIFKDKIKEDQLKLF